MRSRRSRRSFAPTSGRFRRCRGGRPQFAGRRRSRQDRERVASVDVSLAFPVFGSDKTRMVSTESVAQYYRQEDRSGDDARRHRLDGRERRPQDARPQGSRSTGCGHDAWGPGCAQPAHPGLDRSVLRGGECRRAGVDHRLPRAGRRPGRPLCRRDDPRFGHQHRYLCHRAQAAERPPVFSDEAPSPAVPTTAAAPPRSPGSIATTGSASARRPASSR